MEVDYIVLGLTRAQVLMTLYNNSKPLGLGFLQYDPKPMTEIEAEELLKQTMDFDYVKGRIMKINLSKNPFVVTWYDRDNGDGKALRVLIKAAEEFKNNINKGKENA